MLAPKFPDDLSAELNASITQRENTVAQLNRTRLAIHHSYLTAREQANPALHRFLLDVVLYAKMYAF
jgi:hypothetical protein